MNYKKSLVFSNYLKERRKELKLTQVNLAEKTNLSKSAIALYEVEDRIPTNSNLIKLAEALSVDVDILFSKREEMIVNTYEINSGKIPECLLSKYLEIVYYSNRIFKGAESCYGQTC